jgi:hypothetical protein
MSRNTSAALSKGFKRAGKRNSTANSKKMDSVVSSGSSMMSVNSTAASKRKKNSTANSKNAKMLKRVWGF